MSYGRMRDKERQLREEVKLLLTRLTTRNTVPIDAATRCQRSGNSARVD
jgi:hypothetical protein